MIWQNTVRSNGISPTILVMAAILAVASRYLGFALLRGTWDIDGYLAALCTRDCGWYASIASAGYDLTVQADGTANWAFFPVTPLVLAFVHAVTGFSWPLCGLVIGELAAVAACIVSWPLFEKFEAHTLFCTFVLFGPFSYAYGVGMSEPLFFFFSILVFSSVKTGRVGGVVIGAGLMAATRVTGIFVALPIAVELLSALHSDYEDLTEKKRRIVGLIVAIVSAFVGLGAFITYLQLHVGDGLAFVHIQSAWNRALSNPISNIVDGLLLRHHEGYGLTMSLFALLGLVASLRLAMTKQVGMALFTAVSIVASLSTGLLSLVRFVAGLAPITVAASQLARSRISLLLASIVSALLGILFSLMWVGGSPLLT